VASTSTTDISSLSLAITKLSGRQIASFFVVRYLPARAGRILCYYLVYIQPFADMLERENHSRRINVGPQSKSTLLFRSDPDAIPALESCVPHGHSQDSDK
jgi:hypothetical protein